MAEARERSSAAIATSLGLMLGAGPASAGGLYLQEFGTPAMGAAEAGAQALRAMLRPRGTIPPA